MTDYIKSITNGATIKNVCVFTTNVLVYATFVASRM